MLVMTFKPSLEATVMCYGLIIEREDAGSDMYAGVGVETT